MNPPRTSLFGQYDSTRIKFRVERLLVRDLFREFLIWTEQILDVLIELSFLLRRLSFSLFEP